MKIVLITILFILSVRTRSDLLYEDNLEDNLDRGLTKLLDNDDKSISLKLGSRNTSHNIKARNLAKIKFKKLKKRYNKLKKRYARLLILYKLKGYLAKETPLELNKKIDYSNLPKKHARRLVKLKRMAKKHQREMKDHIENHHYYEESDLTPSDNDSWLNSAVKRTAGALGIHNNMDALVAGAGTGALAYGVHHKNKMTNQKRQKALYIQKIYVLKESVAKMLTREIKSLGTLIDVIDEANRKVTQTGDNICANIDNKILYMVQ